MKLRADGGRPIFMIEVILDSNFLFVPFQFHLDIFAELEALVGRFEPIVLSSTLEEMDALLRKPSEKIRQQALSAIELTKRCRLVEVERKSGESCDDTILRIAKQEKCIVATNDATLRKRLREEGIVIVFLRQKSRLEVEGYLPC